MPKLFIGYRLSLIVLVLTLFSLILVPQVFAQSSDPTNSDLTTDDIRYTNTQALPDYVSPQSPTYSNLMIFNFMHGVSCIAVGQSPIGPCVEYQVQKDIQGKMQTTPVLSSINTSGGLLGSIGSVLTAMYTYKPINSGEFFIGLGKDMGIASEAHAQVGGSGNGVLSPIFKLWETSRNFAYLILIIIFLVIGLMVMFRNKVNPQTIITVQAALPGLIIGLLLITFSYFLASLISDLAFIGTDLVGYYFTTAQGPTSSPAPLINKIADQNVLKIFAPLTTTISWAGVKGALESIWDDLHDPNVNPIKPWEMDPQKALWLITTLLFAQLLLPFGSAFGGWGQIVAGGIAVTTTTASPTAMISGTISFIAMIVLIIAMFKLLLRLINNFLSIIFLTISAPFQFLAASLPGRQGLATDWMRNMLCNVLAFPAVIAVFYFVAFLLGKTDIPALPISAGTNITNSATFPLFGGLNLDFVKLLLTFGALVATPAIPDIICRAIGKVGQAGQLIGQEISGGIREGRGYGTQFQQGTQGFAQQAGRLNDQTTYQLVGKPGGGYEMGEGKTPGQFTRMSKSFGNLVGRFPKRGGGAGGVAP